MSCWSGNYAAVGREGAERARNSLMFSAEDRDDETQPVGLMKQINDVIAVYASASPASMRLTSMKNASPGKPPTTGGGHGRPMSDTKFIRKGIATVGREVGNERRRGRDKWWFWKWADCGAGRSAACGASWRHGIR